MRARNHGKLKMKGLKFDANSCQMRYHDTGFLWKDAKMLVNAFAVKQLIFFYVFVCKCELHLIARQCCTAVL
jgi:hypothetical protein